MWRGSWNCKTTRRAVWICTERRTRYTHSSWYLRRRRDRNFAAGTQLAGSRTLPRGRGLSDQCLAIAENEAVEDESPSLDKSRVFYDLGQAYTACRTTSRRRFVWWKRPRPRGRSRNKKYSPCCSVWTCCNARKIGLLFGHLALWIWTIAEISPSEKACPFREKLFRFLPKNCQPLLLLVAMCWAAGATNKANTLYLNDHHLLCRGIPRGGRTISYQGI